MIQSTPKPMYAPSSLSKTLIDLLAAHKWAVMTSSTAVGADEQTLLRQPFSGQGCSQRQGRGASAAASYGREGGSCFQQGLRWGGTRPLWLPCTKVAQAMGL